MSITGSEINILFLLAALVSNTFLASSDSPPPPPRPAPLRCRLRVGWRRLSNSRLSTGGANSKPQFCYSGSCKTCLQHAVFAGLYYDIPNLLEFYRFYECYGITTYVSTSTNHAQNLGLLHTGTNSYQLACFQFWFDCKHFIAEYDRLPRQYLCPETVQGIDCSNYRPSHNCTLEK